MVGYGASIPQGAERDISIAAQAAYLARDLDAPLRRIEDGKHFRPEDFPEIVAEEIMTLVAAT